MSELRQQLRKRGLPVSGTKPALLQRLRPFQLPRTCVTPTPLCQLGTSLDPLTPSSALLPPNQNPSSSPCSGPDSPSNNPNQKMYPQPSGLPNGILNGVENGIPNGILNGVPNAISISMGGEQCELSKAVFLAPAGSPSATPSPGLPPASSSTSSSPLHAGTTWQPEQEQQQQELSLELEMRERMRSRPRERASSAAKEVRIESSV